MAFCVYNKRYREVDFLEQEKPHFMMIKSSQWSIFDENIKFYILNARVMKGN